MLYQKTGAGYQNLSSPVSVIEWDVRTYFNRAVESHVHFPRNSTNAHFWVNSQIGFQYDVFTATEVDGFSDEPIMTRHGDGDWHSDGTFWNGPRRFWKIRRTEQPSNEL